jgi:hypothetical protein
MCSGQERCALADVDRDGRADALAFLRSTGAAREGVVYVAFELPRGLAHPGGAG